MRYLLDSNTYIQAKNFYYNMSFCPAYWEWLDLKYAEGDLGSISSVYEELYQSQNGDELSDWVRERKSQFVDIDDNATQEKYMEIIQYTYELPNKSPDKVDLFLSKADPWLIAKACVTGAKIVTHEKTVPDNSKNVKIPNICKKFNVVCITSFELLQELNAQFILKTI